MSDEERPSLCCHRRTEEIKLTLLFNEEFFSPLGQQLVLYKSLSLGRDTLTEATYKKAEMNCGLD